MKVISGAMLSIRGHDADVFSAGYLCRKGVALRDFHQDDDRLRTPAVFRNSDLVEATGKKLFYEIDGDFYQLGSTATTPWLLPRATHRLTKWAGCFTFQSCWRPLAHAPFLASVLGQIPKELGMGLMIGHRLTKACPTSSAARIC